AREGNIQRRARSTVQHRAFLCPAEILFFSQTKSCLSGSVHETFPDTIVTNLPGSLSRWIPCGRERVSQDLEVFDTYCWGWCSEFLAAKMSLETRGHMIRWPIALITLAALLGCSAN